MPKKPQIAIVISHPIQHFCPQYVSFAQNKNCHVKVFFGSTLGLKKYHDLNFNNEISWGNLKLEKFDHIFLNGESVIPVDKNLDAVSLEKELASYHPDLIITYGYFQKLQRRAYRWAIKNRVPLAFISDSELRHKRNRLKQLVKSFILRRYFSKISYFLSVGNANEEYYYNYGVNKKKIMRMHFPIDIEDYRNSYLEKQLLNSQIRQQYKIKQNEIVLSVVGKLTPWKNQEHIINAMKLLEVENIHLHLFILGSGEMREEMENKARLLVKSKVHFPGFVKIEDLPAYYAVADIYVHPAAVEPHSIAVSEAIYMGCPIIISDRCGSYGAGDDVQDGKNGYVFPFGNIELLAEAIKSLISDACLRKEFGIHSHKIALAFQNNAHDKILNELIERLNSDHN